MCERDTGWLGCVGWHRGGIWMGRDRAPPADNTPGSRTSTSPASSNSARTGNALKTTTSSSGNAAPPSGSSTSVSTTTWCVSRPPPFPYPGSPTLTQHPPTPQNLEKVIPDQPKHSTPVHLRQTQVFAHNWIQRWEKPFIAAQPETPSESSPSS